ncbi:hypothetical protein [Flavobacterium selenitireducens]|uniref:hypothetical protein n=1 Tax=Flavobacterium selenitireducens TaxID=2722704 RepID=UPI00168B5CA0|nr:hypothetical protein [Flavobacterium selenitireducens]MBD3581744.1 hypothetical protein [Flavobacterium selenitireducens]
MKKFILIGILAVFSSCSTNKFYQIYKTKPVASDSQSNVYETPECRISYDFWAEGGDAGFTIYNKTSEPLTVNMAKSFYIVNGKAYDYFQARTFMTAKSETKAAYASTYLYRLNMASSAAVSSGHSTSYVERPEIIIPPKSAKDFREYTINLLYFPHCDLVKYPTKRKIKSVNFGLENSPFAFSNSISYVANGKPTTVVHDFYVHEIVNLPLSEEIKNVKLERCDRTVNGLKHVNESKDNFYIEYSKK